MALVVTTLPACATEAPVVPVAQAAPAMPAAGPVRQWRMRRHCALSPRQVLQAFLALALLKVAVGTAFWLAGLPWVALHSALCLCGVAVALLAHARHAGDQETLTLADGCLRVDQHDGLQHHRAELQAAWVRVEWPDDRQPLALCQGTRRIHVGRHAPPPQRARLARELRQALRGAAGPG